MTIAGHKVASGVRWPILVLAAAPRAWAAFADQGLFWPDEFYQSIEQAHRFAFGYGLVPWEFAEGARSWVFPGLIGLGWKALAMLGVARAEVLIVSAKLAMAAIAVLGVEVAMRLGQRLGGAKAAALAGVAVAMFPAMVLFGSKCMTETVSAPLVLAATLLAWKREPDEPHRDSRLVVAGALAALAIYFRYQNGIVTAGLLGILLVERRWRDARLYAIAALAVGLAGGLLDAATWGRPFHSFLQYARFHAENRAAPWGTDPFLYYVKYTWHSAGSVMFFVVAGFALSLRRAFWHGVLVVVYLVVHSLVPHKEYRYVMPIVPLLLTLAAGAIGPELDGAASELRGRFARLGEARWLDALLGGAACLLALVMFGERAVRMTFADLGHGDGLAADLASGADRPWHAAEGINRLLWKAGEAPDACGVIVDDVPWSSTGGYAYLHRDIPLFFDAPPRHRDSANYAIVRAGRQSAPRFRLYRPGPESRGFVLMRRDGACSPPPEGYTRMMPP